LIKDNNSLNLFKILLNLSFKIKIIKIILFKILILKYAKFIIKKYININKILNFI